MDCRPSRKSQNFRASKENIKEYLPEFKQNFLRWDMENDTYKRKR